MKNLPYKLVEQYFVNEALLTVVCKTSVIHKATGMVSGFAVGKAVCSMDDEFDETTGKKLASARAKFKIAKAMNRTALDAYERLEKHLGATLDATYDFLEKSENHLDGIEDRLNYTGN